MQDRPGRYLGLGHTHYSSQLGHKFTLMMTRLASYGLSSLHGPLFNCNPLLAEPSSNAIKEPFVGVVRQLHQLYCLRRETAFMVSYHCLDIGDCDLSFRDY